MSERPGRRPDGSGAQPGAHGVGHRPIVPFPEDRLPPLNIEAEKGVLGAIIIDPTVMDSIVDIVSPDDFFRDDHQVIARALWDLHRTGSPIDALILEEELKRRGDAGRLGSDLVRFDYYTEMVNSIPHALHAATHAWIVADHARRRRVIEVQSEISHHGYALDISTDEMLDKAQAKLDALRGPKGDEDGWQIRPWPKPPAAEAWHGLAGDFVRFVEPYNEADPVAMLMQFLAAFGTIVGRNPHFYIGTEHHGCNLFVAIVGNSSQAKKGTSWNATRELFRRLDEDFVADRIKSGLSSAEGAIDQIRDGYSRGDATFSGVDDKRVLFMESEIGGLLTIMGRDGNTLSTFLRQAWDGSSLGSLSRKSPVAVREPHVGVIAHGTGADIDKRLTQENAANGFANRFLWCCARRSKLLPDPPVIPHAAWNPLVIRLNEAIQRARQEPMRLIRTEAARVLWHDRYGELTRNRTGLLGATLSRAAPQVVRLSMVYALLDESFHVDIQHMQAALAVWQYCMDSAAYIFGSSLGDPDSEKLFVALEAAGEKGLNRREIAQQVFKGKKSAAEIAKICERLYRDGLAEVHEHRGNGRPSHVWRASS